jgi:hypothetical protein
MISMVLCWMGLCSLSVDLVLFYFDCLFIDMLVRGFPQYQVSFGRYDFINLKPNSKAFDLKTIYQNSEKIHFCGYDTSAWKISEVLFL